MATGRLARLVEAGPQDRERIIRFLRAEFFCAEPLNAAFQTPQGPSNARYMRALGALEHGCALLAVDDTPDEEDLVGLLLCVETPTPRSHLPPDLKREGAGPYARVLWTLEALEAAAQQRCPAAAASSLRRALEVRVLCVAERARRRGLAAQLLERAVEQARVRRCRVLSMWCTGAFSAALARRAGMRCVFSEKYASLVERGVMPRLPPAPHAEAALYMLEDVDVGEPRAAL